MCKSNDKKRGKEKKKRVDGVKYIRSKSLKQPTQGNRNGKKKAHVIKKACKLDRKKKKILQRWRGRKQRERTVRKKKKEHVHVISLAKKRKKSLALP